MRNTIAPPQIGWRVPAAWLTLCVVWSSTWLAIKVGLRDLPPISFVALRFLIAIAVLLAVSVGRVPLLPVRRSDYTILAGTGLLMFAVNYALLFWAELHVSSGLAAVLQTTIPIFGMLFAHWMLPDEPLRSGILLLTPERPTARAVCPETLRTTLRDGGVAATTYEGGLVRLSISMVSWRFGADWAFSLAPPPLLTRTS